MRYKWTLRNSSKKEICPQCGQRRLVPYVLTADGVTMAGAEYGRCDREYSCGYNRRPGSDIEATPKPVKERPTPAPIVFQKQCATVKHSTLLDYAVELCGQDAYLAWDKYKVGASRTGRTIFWYISKNGIVRGGKEIAYKPDGHRDKAAFPPALWAHADLNFHGYFTGEKLLQPFFGEHLLKDDTNAKVAIVESEKTAVLMSCFLPDTIWLACGGSQGLKNPDKHKVLQRRSVVLIPDHGQFFNWKNTAEKYGYKILDFCERKPIFEGCDILDYYTQTNTYNDTK